jgi:hypothetical protein
MDWRSAHSHSLYLSVSGGSLRCLVDIRTFLWRYLLDGHSSLWVIASPSWLRFSRSDALAAVGGLGLAINVVHAGCRATRDKALTEWLTIAADRGTQFGYNATHDQGPSVARRVYFERRKCFSSLHNRTVPCDTPIGAGRAKRAAESDALHLVVADSDPQNRATVREMQKVNVAPILRPIGETVSTFGQL